MVSQELSLWMWLYPFLVIVLFTRKQWIFWALQKSKHWDSVPNAFLISSTFCWIVLKVANWVFILCTLYYFYPYREKTLNLSLSSWLKISYHNLISWWIQEKHILWRWKRSYFRENLNTRTSWFFRYLMFWNIKMYYAFTSMIIMAVMLCDTERLLHDGFLLLCHSLRHMERFLFWMAWFNSQRGMNAHIKKWLLISRFVQFLTQRRYFQYFIVT